MSFFSLFKKNKTVTYNNDILALTIFSRLGLGVPKIMTPLPIVNTADSIIFNLNNKDESIKYGLSLICDCKNPLQRYLLAVGAYSLKKVEIDVVICAIENYLNNTLYNVAISNLGYYPKFLKEDIVTKKNIHIEYMTRKLADSYSKKKSFAKATELYKQCIKLTPFYHYAYCNLANMHTKLGDTDYAMIVLHEAKKSRFYIPASYLSTTGKAQIDSAYKRAIDKALDKLQNTIENKK